MDRRIFHGSAQERTRIPLMAIGAQEHPRSPVLRTTCLPQMRFLAVVTTHAVVLAAPTCLQLIITRYIILLSSRPPQKLLPPQVTSLAEPCRVMVRRPVRFSRQDQSLQPCRSFQRQDNFTDNSR